MGKASNLEGETLISYRKTIYFSFFYILLLFLALILTLYSDVNHVSQLLLLMFISLAMIPTVLQLAEGELNFFRPDHLIALSFFFYTVPVPLDYLCLGNAVESEAEYVNAALLLSILFIASFLIGYYAPLKSEARYNLIEKNRLSDVSIKWWFPTLLVITGLSLYLYYIFVICGGFGQFVFEMSRIERFQLSKGQGWSISGLYLVQAGWLLFFVRSLIKATKLDTRKRFNMVLLGHTLLFVLYMTFFLLIGNRRQFILLGLSAIIIVLLFRKTNQGLLFVVGVLGVLVLQIYSKVRHYSTDPVELVWFLRDTFQLEWFNFAFGEFGCQFKVMLNLLKDSALYELRWGSTYLDAFLILIPSFLFPDRPLPISEEYAMYYKPEYYDAGGGAAFSLIGEAYLNFGIVGPILLGLAMGLIARSVYSKICYGKLSETGIVSYALFLPLLFHSPRTDFASLLKITTLSLALGLFLPYMLYRLFYKKNRE